MENQTLPQEKKEFNNVEYQKKYYQDYKDKLLERLKQKSKCEICNGSYSYVSKNRHLQSAKHKKFINYIPLGQPKPVLD